MREGDHDIGGGHVHSREMGNSQHSAGTVSKVVGARSATHLERGKSTRMSDPTEVTENRQAKGATRHRM